MTLFSFHFSIALEYPAIPPTDNTPIIASTPSISIILRPDWEKVPYLRPQHPSFLGLSQESSLNQRLCNNMANLLTRLETRCNKILCTDCASRPRMTGARDASPLHPVILLLCLLLPNISFFLPNPAKTCWTAEKAPLIRCSGFAERERETFA